MDALNRIKFLEDRLHRLSEIGMALSTEKNTDRLFEMILEEAKNITQADGRTLYSVNKDGDLDFEILSENFEEFKTNILNKLLNKGFYLIHAHLIKTGEIGSLTIGKGRDRIDFQIIFKNKNDKCYHFLWNGGLEMTKGFSRSYYEDIKKYELEGLSFYGPREAESYLKDMYGENWRVPCKSENEYKFWKDSPGIPWKFKYRHYKLVKDKKLEELLNVSK